MLDSPNRAFELVPVRSAQDYMSFEDRSQVKYIKLNGCLSDINKYKLIFSSADFKRANKFYQTVLKPLQALGPKITFISVGYSYSDPLAKHLISKFDSFNFRDRKWMYNVDPYIQDYRLPKLTEDRIAAVKLSGEHFFSLYSTWEEDKYKGKLNQLGIKVSNSKNEKLRINHKLSYNLHGIIKQLNSTYQGAYIKEKEFYLGEEPNYSVILHDYDVIKKDKVNKTVSEIMSHILTGNSTNIIPLIFLSGSFGTGKTTSIYRVIHEIVSNEKNDVVAFELIDLENTCESNILALLNSIDVKNIIFYCNNIELDSVLKGFLNLRIALSKEQLPKNIVFLTSIRENILEKHREAKLGSNTSAIDIDTPLASDEIDHLLEKLQVNQLVAYRDIAEKNALKSKIKNQFKGDTFISLLDLVTNGQHIQDLRNAYSSLSPKCKEAFVYTALVHRYNLFMPAGVLKNILNSDWEVFTEKVIKVEGKGILIQEELRSKGVDPDLFFRTKHKTIAERLIQEVLKSKEKRFKSYKKIVGALTSAPKYSRFCVNLIKSLRENSEFDELKVNTLFDIAALRFGDDPHFLLHYATNLQHRRSNESLQAAIDILIHAESLLSKRDHRFVHRRGVINFELAKSCYKEETELDRTYDYLDEAEELFGIKLQLDPCSSYSYYDYLDMSLWELENVVLEKDEEFKVRMFIEDSINTAYLVLNEGRHRIQTIYERYSSKFQFAGNSAEYIMSLDEQYKDPLVRPYVCVLMINYFEKENNEDKVDKLLTELESYSDNEEISRFLFRFYGRRLYNVDIRVKFFKMSSILSTSSFNTSLRFNYFNSVAHAYNTHFSESISYSQRIDKSYSFISPEFKLKWMNPDGMSPRDFEGTVVKSQYGSLMFRSKEHQFKFRIGKNTSLVLKEGEARIAELHFFLNGIFAVIVDAN